MTRARVPASVESNPPLYVPRESLDDMTRERSDKFTPGLVKQMRLKIMFRKQMNPPTNDAIYVTITKLLSCEGGASSDLTSYNNKE
jgi:hypothetical protein